MHQQNATAPDTDAARQQDNWYIQLPTPQSITTTQKTEQPRQTEKKERNVFRCECKK